MVRANWKLYGSMWWWALQVLFRDLVGGTDENHEKSRVEIDPITPGLQLRSVAVINACKVLILNTRSNRPGYFG
jgi:hypothetical protein